MSSNAFAQSEREYNDKLNAVERANDIANRAWPFPAARIGIQTTVTWRDVKDEFPDAENVVLGSISGGSDPVWPVFTDGKEWFDACSGSEMDGRVTHWCEFPMGVEK